MVGKVSSRQFLLKRLILVMPTLFGISLMCFFLIHLTPGSPWTVKTYESQPGESSEESRQSFQKNWEQHYGLNLSLGQRYFKWLGKVVRGDFGESSVYEMPVWNVIWQKFSVSWVFGFTSLFLTYLICVPLGVLKAARAGTWLDLISSAFLYFFYSLPILVLAIGLIQVFASGENSILPMGFLQSDHFDDLELSSQIWDRLKHMILPVLCYISLAFAELTFLTRNSMLEVFQQNFVRTTRATGMSEWNLLFRSALKNSLIPVAASIVSFSQVFLAGNLIIEKVFQIDGVGLLSYRAVMARDYNILMALILLTAVFLLFTRLLSDLLYLWLDPRVDFQW